MAIEPPISSRRAFLTGFPLSSASSWANSSACFSSRSPSVHTIRDRSAGDSRDQGPESERLAGRSHSLIDVGLVGRRDMADDFLCRGILHRKGFATACFDPLSGDQHAVFLAQKRRGGFAERGFVQCERHKHLRHLFDNLRSSYVAISRPLIEFGAAGGRHWFRSFPGLDCVGRLVLEGPPEGSTCLKRHGEGHLEAIWCLQRGDQAAMLLGASDGPL